MPPPSPAPTLASSDYLLFPLTGGHDPLGVHPVSLLLACSSGGGLLLHLDSQASWRVLLFCCGLRGARMCQGHRPGQLGCCCIPH